MTETLLYEPHALLLGRGVSLFRAGAHRAGNLGRTERATTVAEQRTGQTAPKTAPGKWHRPRHCQSAMTGAN